MYCFRMFCINSFHLIIDAMKLKGKNVKTNIEILPLGPTDKKKSHEEEKENTSDTKPDDSAPDVDIASSNQSVHRTLIELHPSGNAAQSKPKTQPSQSHMAPKRDAIDILEDDDDAKPMRTKRVTLSDDVVVHDAPYEEEEEPEEEVFTGKSKPRGRRQEAECIPVSGEDSNCKVQ